MIHLPYRILAIEDELSQQQLYGSIFPPPEFRFTALGSAEDFIANCNVGDFDVVLLDHGLPGLNGQEVCRYIREGLGQRFLPVIMVTGYKHPDIFTAFLEAGASDCIGKPYSIGELVARVRGAARQRRLLAHLDDAESVLFALARMIEARDGTTGDHCTRLAYRARAFGNLLGLGFDDIEALERGAVLHDIGKVAIPDAILLKPGPLSEAEWQIMRRHPEIGEQLCRPLATMSRTLPIIRSHHERWNGQGYPDGLAGEQIPLLARIFQLLDIHDALSNPRHYKPAFDRQKVMEQMAEDAGRGYFDPRLFKAFFEILLRQPDLLDVPGEPGPGGWADSKFPAAQPGPSRDCSSPAPGGPRPYAFC